MIAVQVKHSSFKTRKIGSDEVIRMKGVLELNPIFAAGMIVTNTAFTADARWVSQRLEKAVQLREGNDIVKWLGHDFFSTDLLGTEIELAKGVRFKIELRSP